MTSKNLKPPFTGPNKTMFLTLWVQATNFEGRRQERIDNGGSRFACNVAKEALLQAQQYQNVSIGALQLLELCGPGFPPFMKKWETMRKAR